MHRIRSDARRCAAVESPKLVPTARYPARHAGRFGTSPRMRPEQSSRRCRDNTRQRQPMRRAILGRRRERPRAPVARSNFHSYDTYSHVGLRRSANVAMPWLSSAWLSRLLRTTSPASTPRRACLRSRFRYRKPSDGAIETAVEANNRTDGYVRVIVTRGPHLQPTRSSNRRSSSSPRSTQPFRPNCVAHGLHAMRPAPYRSTPRTRPTRWGSRQV